MAKDAANSVSYVLEIAQQHQHYLAGLRHHTQLSIARQDGWCWIKGLTPEQMVAAEVISIPFIRRYYLQGQHLFFMGGLVPEKLLPQGLQFLPLTQGLPVSLPAFNHNYFGIHQQVPVALAAADKEQPACGMLVPLHKLQQYINTAAAIRLQSLQWLVLDGVTALVLGTPVLPVAEAQILWKNACFLLPAGYDFEYPALSVVLQQQMQQGGELILWMANGTWLPLSAQHFKTLSISSFRLTMQRLGEQGKMPGHGR